MRAITMETPPPPQQGRACSLFRCVLREEELVTPGSCSRKERHLYRECRHQSFWEPVHTGKWASHLVVMLPVVMQFRKLTVCLRKARLWTPRLKDHPSAGALAGGEGGKACHLIAPGA